MEDTTTPPPQLHSIADTLQRIPVGRSKLYEEISSGRLTVVKIGRRSFVSDNELRRYIDSLPKGIA